MSVTIVHPDLGESTCSESAVRLHERNGWKRKPAEEPGLPLTSASVADLRKYAADRGIDLSGATRKADVLEAIEAFEASASDEKAPAPVADDLTTNSPTAGEES